MRLLTATLTSLVLLGAIGCSTPPRSSPTENYYQSRGQLSRGTVRYVNSESGPMVRSLSETWSQVTEGDANRASQATREALVLLGQLRVSELSGISTADPLYRAEINALVNSWELLGETSAALAREKILREISTLYLEMYRNERYETALQRMSAEDLLTVNGYWSIQQVVSLASEKPAVTFGYPYPLPAERALLRQALEAAGRDPSLYLPRQ